MFPYRERDGPDEYRPFGSSIRPASLNDSLAVLADRVRDEAAKRAGLRTSVLDRMVEDRRSAGNAAIQDGPVPPEAEPWPEPVDGAELLGSITGTIKRFLVSGPMVPEIL